MSLYAAFTLAYGSFFPVFSFHIDKQNPGIDNTAGTTSVELNPRINMGLLVFWIVSVGIQCLLTYWLVKARV